MSLISVAQITKPFGLDGRVRCKSLTSYPEERFKKGRKLYLCKGNEEPAMTVTVLGYFGSNPMLTLTLEEITSVEEAEKYRGYELKIEEAEAPLPENAYRIKDLLGCAIVSEEGKKLGTITDVLSYGPTDNFRVKREGCKDFFVPFVLDKFVLKVDIKKKEVTVRVVEGML